MKVIDPGHVYDLDWLDVEPGLTAEAIEGVGCNRLIFVKREGEKYPGNIGHHPGTNMQEVLRALIDRLKYVDKQIPHELNRYAINNLRKAIYNLEFRAAERHGRQLRFDSPSAILGIEDVPTCKKCGHIGCEGECR